MRRSGINTTGYRRYDGLNSEIPFPKAVMRNIACVTRNVSPIEGYKAICDPAQDLVYAIVSDEYKLVQHQEVLNVIDQICLDHPEWGDPTRSVYLSPNGARKKAVWRFPDIQFEIRPGDVVNPTIEAFSSFDTSLAQHITLGGFRLVCSNGAVIGKMLAEYKRKHTSTLDLNIAGMTIDLGMQSYSKVAQLWQSYAARMALQSEYTLFEELPFHKNEKENILAGMQKVGTILKWDIEEGKKVRKAEINSWEMYNLLTYEATHTVQDLARQARIFEGISKGFKQTV